MKKKLILFISSVSCVLYHNVQAQTTTPTVITNKGDKISITDLKVEPWFLSNTTSQATGNTQSIYQNGNVGIGNYSTLTPGSRLEIRANNTAHLGLVNSGNESKFDIAKEANALTFTSRSPLNQRIMNLYSDGSLYLGTFLLNDNVNAGSNTSAGFVYHSPQRRLGINLPNTEADPAGAGLPTETLDIGGNARIRSLVDGSNSTNYPNIIVANNAGVLGKSSIAGISSAAEPWNVTNGTTKASDNTQNIYQTGKVAIGDYQTSNSTAKFEVKPGVNEETIRLQDVKETSATTASFDGATGSYYDVKISEEGYIRKFKPTPSELTQSILYDLKTNYTAQRFYDAPNLVANSGTLTKMNWQYSKPDGTTATTTDITLPADGAYVFSFRLYGQLLTTNSTTQPVRSLETLAYYIYAMKNNATFDLAEMNIINAGIKNASYGQATYSINLTVSGKKGDVVSFILTEWFSDSGSIEWKLTGNPGKQANKTSMFFWKL